MLIFIMALQSPYASKDWSRVSKLCERTLRSVCAQSNAAFKVFLVCNSRPLTEFTHPALTVIEQDFPLPEETSRSRMEDKWRKLKTGLLAARQDKPAFVMMMDADDCVHCDLADYVARNSGSVGWTFDQGYVHDEGSSWIHKRSNFSDHCGSSAIIRLDPSDYPRSMSESSDNYFILANGHSTIKHFMISRGTPLHNLPFPGAVWMTNTGENDSGTRIAGWQGFGRIVERLRTARPLTNDLKSTFGIYNLDHVGKQ